MPMPSMPLGKDALAVLSPVALDPQNSCQNDTEFSLTHGSPAVLYSINAINALICFIGLTGNILVFYVVCRFSAMHTVTNIFILSLALADIAFLVNIPFLMTTAILENWPFGNIYCKIYYSMTTVNQFASSFFLVTMSADRYVAICLPIQSRRIRTTKTAILVCCIVWALAIMLMYPVFLYAETDSSDDFKVTHCNIFWPDFNSISGNHAFALYCFVLGYAFPVAFMLTFYGLVVQRLRSRNTAHEQRGSISNGSTTNTTRTILPVSRSNQRRRSRLRKVTVMIFCVIVVYLLCWTPYWASQLYITFSPTSQFNHMMSCPLTAAEIQTSQRIVYTSLVLQCLCFANSAVNPILYAVLSENFKQSFAKACHRVTHPTLVEEPTIARESSFRPEFCSQHKFNPHQRFSVDQETDGHLVNGDTRKIYFSCNMQSPSLLLTPASANGQLTSFTDVSSLNPSSQAPAELEHNCSCNSSGGGTPSPRPALFQGEVVTSFQITAWTPLLSNHQEPVVTRRTMLTTLEMSAAGGSTQSSRKSF
ncbi:putative Somatostatin receptor type 1 [Hypsibius exemplaris]|uniref:Somatostatin receptor type 1 n=1 Tax=Hypsibius exemplaris TaxID=2072580 RepID=A0A1W0XC38_HYPEX|nr:putative Somatostatin receptor type 1 [Hypsibius exemplaris]